MGKLSSYMHFASVQQTSFQQVSQESGAVFVTAQAPAHKDSPFSGPTTFT